MSNFIQAEIESASGILGWLMMCPEKILELTITPNMLVSHPHREALQAVITLHSQGKPFSPIDVEDQLKLTGYGLDFARLMGWVESMNSVSASGSISDMEARVRKAHACRMAHNVAEALIEHANRGDVEAMQSAITPIMTLMDERKKYDYSFAEMIDMTLQDAADRMEGHGNGCISTGISSLDEQIGGFHNSDLIVLGARPAMGKTALMINMALGSGGRVGIFSGEQGVIQMGYRVMSISSGAEIGKIRKGVDEEVYQQLSMVVPALANSGSRIYDKSAPTVTEICAKAREWKVKYGIRGIYIDYLQRIKWHDTKIPKHEQVGNIAMSLKELARELDIPVIALAQVNRNVESRADKRPGTGDLKDSGTIEQEADQILTLYRDEVYNEDTMDRGIAEIDVKKNRHGATGCINTEWIAKCMKFISFGEKWTPAQTVAFECDQDEDHDDWKKNDPLWG